MASCSIRECDQTGTPTGPRCKRHALRKPCLMDPAHGQFFVSNFEDGLIYRLDAGSGAILNTFDHGVNGRPDEGLSPIPDDPGVDFTPSSSRTTSPAASRISIVTSPAPSSPSESSSSESS